MIETIDHYGWIIPLQHRYHIQSVHHIIQFYNGTAF